MSNTLESVMSHLPAQEAEADTYFAVETIKHLIRTNTPGNHGNVESHTGAIWNVILQLVFPAAEDYAVTPELIVHGGRMALLNITHWMARSTGGQRYEIKFFVVGYKSAIHESQDSAWTEARVQTLGYLQSIEQSCRNHPNQQSTTLYGAVAIGNWVRFYRYDDEKDDLVDLFGLDADGPLYHIGRQCATVHRALVRSKQSH